MLKWEQVVGEVGAGNIGLDDLQVSRAKVPGGTEMAPPQLPQ